MNSPILKKERKKSLKIYNYRRKEIKNQRLLLKCIYVHKKKKIRIHFIIQTSFPRAAVSQKNQSHFHARGNLAARRFPIRLMNNINTTNSASGNIVDVPLQTDAAVFTEARESGLYLALCPFMKIGSVVQQTASRRVVVGSFSPFSSSSSSSPFFTLNRKRRDATRREHEQTTRP